MPLEDLFKAMAIRLNGPKAAALEQSFALDFTDLEERWLLQLRHGVLHAFRNRSVDAPAATLRVHSHDFKALMLRIRDPASLLQAGRLSFEGDIGAFAALAELFDQFDPRFPLVTPRPAW